MALKIRLEFEGGDRVDAAFDIARWMIWDGRNFNKIGQILLENNKERFRRAVDPEGVMWPVSRAAEERARNGRPQDTTLIDTGRLLRSLYTKKEDEFSWLLSYNKGGIAPYGWKHLEGAFGLPKRVFIGINEQDKYEILAYVEDRIINAVNRIKS